MFKKCGMMKFDLSGRDAAIEAPARHGITAGLPASDHYNPQTGRFYNAVPLATIPLKESLSIMYRMLKGARDTRPATLLPCVTPDWQAFGAPAQTSRFIWFGHSSIMMRVAGQTLFTDPVFGASVSPLPGMFRRFQPAPAPRKALPKVDVVLISHNHFDHLEAATSREFAQRGSHFVVPTGTARQLIRWGVPAHHITELDWYQHTWIEGVKYTAVPARHSTGRGLSDQDKTLWAGWVIEGGGEKIYFSGDSGYGEHFAEIGRHFGGFDLAFIENGQYDLQWASHHMQPEETVMAAQDVRTKQLVPIHWGMFSLAFHTWNDPVKRSVPLARARGLNVLTPLLGEVFTCDSQTQDWWQTA